MVSKTTVIWCGVGVTAGAAILGYCIYFDKKRRNDPEFKRKLRESNFCMNRETFREKLFIF